MNIQGMNVTYTDDKGAQHSLFAGGDFEMWSKLMANSDKQNNAASRNTNVSAAYLLALNDYAQAPDKTPMPVKPKQLVVSDMGTETYVDFSPALPDPVVFNPGTPAPSQGSGKATTNLPPMPLTDGEKAIMAGLNYLIGLVQKLQPKAGA